MKTEGQPSSDAALEAVLREWQTTEPLPPRFQARVWQRIAQAEASPRAFSRMWADVGLWLQAAFSRPAMAVAYLAILLLFGAAGGFWQASDRVAREHEELRARYVASVDPYRKPRL
jgi:hypothetical protein